MVDFHLHKKHLAKNLKLKKNLSIKKKQKCFDDLDSIELFKLNRTDGQ